MDSTIHKLEGLRLQNLQNNVHYTCSPCGKHNCFVCLTKCEACRNLNCSCRTIEYGNEISRVKPKPSIYNNSLIKVGGVGDFCEIKSFRDANLPEVLIENLRKLLYKVPTPVQSIAIPILLEGKDLVARAETGSGKTAAFLIPIVSTLIKRKTVNSMNPFAVILTPTRELALQIEREALLLTENTFIKPVCTYGGITIGHQKKKIAKGCDILIGTLGRILHLAKQSMLSLKELKILIIDEGDHMLDKNFVKDIGKLVHDFDMPEKSLRQTALFCATIPTTQIIHDDKGVKKKLAFFTDTVCMFLNDTYCHVDVGNNLVTPKSIIQQFLFVDKLELKFQLLEKKIAEELSNENKTIVFIETIKETIKVAQQLCIKDYPVTVIHGRRTQNDRKQAMYEFNEGLKPLLICTNVSARGLDIFEVKTVINYNLPNLTHDDIRTYVYRIGRAGRIGNPGKSISLFLKGRDEVLAKPLVVLLGGSQQEVPTWLEELCLVREMAKLGNYSQAIYETKRVAMLTEKNSSDDTRRFEDKGKVKDISYRFSKLTPI
ncbi:ATP-dependent RNA helicase DDX4 [Hydra vulgaris]|uniref:ATP-dependent RNA helicase DDX4 n=1 Tax=Hydra vulgaris TaxID=6087 RepID=UPI000640ED98|nr:ATP-dependent RNA helicase DDX4-like isoform X1 [Hydra vulgaris]